jgi:hypothetical protein
MTDEAVFFRGRHTEQGFEVLRPVAEGTDCGGRALWPAHRHIEI